MSERKIIAVTGATGAQGGGLARAILADTEGGFSVRALTRNPDSEAARALAEQGAETAAADLDDAASLDRAFSGAYGAFCVTNFLEHGSPGREHAQVKNLAHAAKKAGLKHVIWSTLEDSRKLVPLEDDRMPTLMERYKVPHLDVKGESDRFFADAGVPVTNLLTCFYWENFIYFGMGPQPGPGGKPAITLPLGDARMAQIAVEDIGRCSYGILKAGPAYAGKTIGIAGEHLTGQEMADALGKALGREVAYNPISPETFRGLGFPNAEDFGNMFQYFRDFSEEFCGARSVDESRALNPDLLTLSQWLAVNKDRIPL
jgi:uncharacterized protein YbjT (DUF2867 family)